MTAGKPWADKDTLLDLYVKRGFSSREVADVLGCGKKTILRWLDRHGIDKETPTWERPPVYHTLSSGYEQIKAQHKGEQLAFSHHRLLAVSEYGFDEVADSVVHHENRIPWDNRPSNISLIDSQSKHTKNHWESGDMDSVCK